jgi:deoxyribonuclease V
MDIPPLHSWNLSPAQAIALQKQIAAQVDVRPRLSGCKLIAGADVSYNRFATTCYAGVVVLRTRDWSIVETASAVGESTFPYIPGLLSFREAPLLLSAFAKLQQAPDVVMVDGQGIAHPRRLGIASLLGLWLKLPTIGCGKTRLIGEYTEPGPEPGDRSVLRDRGEIIGSVLRTKARTRPLFISPGHLIDLASSIRLVLRSCRGYRQPEPTRQAHLKVNELRRAAQGG